MNGNGVHSTSRTPGGRFPSPARTAALALCALLTAVGCSTKGAASDSRDSASTKADSLPSAREVGLTTDQATRMQITTVAYAPFRPTITTTGTVAFNGDRSTQVLAPVSGPITKILVNPGTYVRRGQSLATVTSPDFASATSGYRKTLSAYRNAQRIADLDAQLFKNDAIARREMEQAQTDAIAAAADRDAAMEQLRALGVDPNAGGGAGSAVIRAPIDGTVVEKLVNSGQLIQAGTTPAFTIADLSTVWVMANVFESDLALVAAGETASITGGASPTPIIGQVVYIGSLVDPGSKATAVRILAPNPHDALKRDMLVNVSIRAAQARNALLIPASAVLRDDQNLPFVFIARPSNRFERRQIVLGMRSGDQYEVRTGLTAGERVVSNGALFVQFAGNQ